ncbi:MULTISPECIES: hypothetical protein [unclassified Roseofilum]|uniref:hypothetical protein n=1 Tax=unclassified Roseofilum TaxID=2620099 RepID=UPI001B1B169A|nr:MULTISPECIES: hypothetical protein [unclassified Roseofilum]MBP0008820.1 hypothetical protein [Roseofilum sp. Belize Diploria]MBP0033502.1 hypothetical protein [Roseofilum sp. Belize BBD 4]
MKQRRFFLIGLGSLGLMGLSFMPLESISPPVALAQSRIRPRDLWRLVYEQLPDFPLENNYVSQLNGEAKPDNTLVERLIRYHLYVKGRTPQYRLDWKLTLADYLGTNEVMYEVLYPSADLLRDNPLEGDRQAIQNLTRSQRNALIDVLVGIYNPQNNRD